jgi:putative sigma-54 modulation protein
MKTVVRWRNYEPSAALGARVTRKVKRLDRMAGEETEATVTIIGGASRLAAVATEAELVLAGPDRTVRSRAAGATPLAALDAVLDRVERQMVQTRERARPGRDKPATPLPQAPIPENAPDRRTATRPRIRKVKRLDMVPMFEEDAITRMNEIGHAFFVFLNAETGAIAVLYRRGPDDYGLIEPVTG